MPLRRYPGNIPKIFPFPQNCPLLLPLLELDIEPERIWWCSLWTSSEAPHFKTFGMIYPGTLGKEQLNATLHVHA